MLIDNLGDLKVRIDLLAFDIDSLEGELRIEAVKHLRESLEVLKLGSPLPFENYPIKTETPNVKQEVLENTKSYISIAQTEGLENTKNPISNAKTPEIKQEGPDITQSYISLYNGLTPTCTECLETFPTLGTLDAHIKKLHAEKYRENLSKSKIALASMSKQTVVPPISTKPKENRIISPKRVKAEPANLEQLVTCPDCDKSFSKKNSMMRHRVCHTDRYKCDKCGKGFSQNRDIDRHLRNIPSCDAQEESKRHGA